MKAWIEAMRLRTLPVSTAGVVMGVALGLKQGTFNVAVTVGCFLFAIMAQIASNFANEYYDFRSGADKPGRVGPRRGVTEGDITPQAMLRAAVTLLLSAAWIGCVMVWYWGQWWMFLVGAIVVVGALGYSAGPYPLSRNGLGEVAVIGFFGVVPVCLTYVLEGALWQWNVLWMSFGIGLMGANVLIVNNYRDVEDDRAAGKLTLAVKMGRNVVLAIYAVNGVIAVMLGWSCWQETGYWQWIVPGAYLAFHFLLAFMLKKRDGARLNPLLGMTAMLMLLYAVAYLVV